MCCDVEKGKEAALCCALSLGCSVLILEPEAPWCPVLQITQTHQAAGLGVWNNSPVVSVEVTCLFDTGDLGIFEEDCPVMFWDAPHSGFA